MTEARQDKFGNLDRLVEALSTLAAEATWPEGEHSEFLGFLANDLVEFAAAIQSEARAERWTTALSLGRSLHERQLYLLAAAIDPGFWNAYRVRMQTRIDRDYRGSSRLLSEVARGVINRWESQHPGGQRLLELSLRVHATSSELLHHSIGVSWLVSQDDQHRNLSLANVETTVRGACAVFLLAMKITGHADQDLYRRVWALVDPPGEAQSPSEEPEGDESR
ncbi:MAG: hypothetical protein F4169_07965 [Gammaproteobacteria bacterium]|nr:hypothetical protein [Chloroflexota bacterium]MYF28788.1 hypothetical protein [Gammaproteobacteria bacterium]